jgi:hypothetical protein
MLIHFTINTPEAVYQFQVNEVQARITRWILKGQKGGHACTSMSTERARKFAAQLQAR